ncbi:MAG TPA: transcriptional repressor [Sphingomonadales bacterium]|nr:transcriptional repressor [Sphingomonadales bacterium]
MKSKRKTWRRHDHRRCLVAALHAAEALCRARGARLTPSRKKVLKMVLAGHAAVKAYDLIAAFDGGRGTTKPPTVYRALDFLLAQGLVHRIESLNAFIGCPSPGAGHASQFFICDTCQGVSEMDARPLTHAIASKARAARFRVTRHNLEIHGICAACASA